MSKIARVQLEDGRIARFEVPDDYTAEQAQAAGQQHFSQTAEPAAQERAPTMAPQGGPTDAAPPQSGLDVFKRRLGILAGGAAKGVMGTVNMAGDALNSALNQLPGVNLGMPSQATQRLLQQLGAPQPQDEGEHVADFLAQMGGGMLDPAGGALVKGIQGSTALGGGKPLYNAPPASSVRDATLRESMQAGYRVPAAEAGARLPARAAEAFAGPGTLSQKMAHENTNVTQALARRAVGLPPDAPLDRATLNRLIDTTVDEGYRPVMDLGQITTGGVYRRALDDIAAKYRGAARASPTDPANAVDELVDSFRVRSYGSGKEAVDFVKKLRSDSNAAYKTGSPEMGAAQRAIADAIEDNIGLNLQAAGRPELLGNFKAARKQLAKQYAVREAIDEGAGTVDIKHFGRMLDAGAPLSDELALMGRFANTAPNVARNAPVDAPVMTEWERAALASGLGGAAHPLFLGGPLWAGSRIATRHALANPTVNRAMAMPAPARAPYDPSLLRALPAGINALGSGLFNLGLTQQ